MLTNHSLRICWGQELWDQVNAHILKSHILTNQPLRTEWAGAKSCGTELMQWSDKSPRTPMSFPVFSPGGSLVISIGHNSSAIGDFGDQNDLSHWWFWWSNFFRLLVICIDKNYSGHWGLTTLRYILVQVCEGARRLGKGICQGHEEAGG